MILPSYTDLFPPRMTPAMAADYLRSGAFPLRGFADALEEMYPAPALHPRLLAAFLDDAPGANPQSVDRSIRNWLSGRNLPQKREEVFQIAFALGLTEDQTDRLLGLATGYCIHYRDGHDLVYDWFLRHKGTYRQARDFLGELPPQPHRWAPPAQEDAYIAQELREAFLEAQTQEDLLACYLAYLPRLGSLHARAYIYFDRCLSQLQHPVDALGEGESPVWSMDAVMSTYLTLRMPTGKRTAGYSPVQRQVKHGWPNTTALKNIRLRRQDVPRKLLMLMYVITENLFDDFSPYDGDDFSDRDTAEENCSALNAILVDCGMPPLDPGDPTDWLILYAISTSGPRSMSEQLEDTIAALFRDVKRRR